ncbi:transposase [Candidatus Poribacteria bacterium]|nr:MAG: transposase [Candidatus Poribacteria bacterium]
MKKTYEYRAYPTTKQRQLFTVWLALLRSIYNQALAWRIEAYQTAGLTVKWTTQANALPDLKQASEAFAGLHSDVLQDAMRRLDKAYKAFFRRAQNGEAPGFPRFKGEGRYRSMTFSHLSKHLVRNVRRKFAKVVVPKIGHLKIRYHRPLPDGKIRNLTILKRASGWYVTICVEVPDPIEVHVHTTIGVDVGLNSFAVDSDGEHIPNPRHYRQAEKRLAKHQRILSRRKKGSKRRAKQREIVARCHQRIANQRKDFQFKAAHRIVERCDEVAVENLTITNMLKNHYLAKSISDAGWGSFRLKLQSKAASAGKQFTKVKPHHTSQKCSGCNEIVPKTVSDRLHDCPHCGLVIDRDHNAAINIKKAAVALRGGVSVVNDPEIPRQGTEARNSVRPVGRTLQTSPVPSGRGN